MTPADTLTTTPATQSPAATEPDADLYTCEACDRCRDADKFRGYQAGECNAPICDECLAVQADTGDWDRYNAAAYYYR
jgi:hypothetical protein